MDRIIFTKTEKTQGFALFNRKNKFWFVQLYYVKFRKGFILDSYLIKNPRAIIVREHARIFKEMKRTYNTPTIRGKVRQVEGRGVRGNKTEDKEIVCINPHIKRSIGLNLDYISDIELILSDYICEWLTEIR